jgi:maltooligosyltrehalose synthase
MAFGRQWQAEAALVLTCRLPLRMEPDLRVPLVRPEVWQGTSIFLPPRSSTHAGATPSSAIN